MSHIDEQIGKIHRLLSPLQPSMTNNPSPVSTSEEKPIVPLRSPPQRPPTLTLTSIATPSDVNPTSFKLSPVLETTSLHSVPNPTSDTKIDLYEPSVMPQTSDPESIALSIPPPPSVYNRSAGSSVLNLGLAAIPRASASNKIAPAASSSNSPRQTSHLTFRPVSNTRYNPGRSPKLRSRSSRNRSDLKAQSSSDKSTVIELESPTENKATPLLTASKPVSSNLFRRFLTNPDSIEKSSSLLYPPTSDDEHPISPPSSGNDDDDHRPLTSSSSKYHHQTLL